MLITTTRSYEFAAAHYLPHYDGKSRNLHGHNYQLEVTLVGEPLSAGPQEGMIRSFAAIDRLTNEAVLSRVDHATLNDVLPQLYPTTELFGIWIYETLSDSFNLRLSNKLTSIRLRETSRGWVEVSA